MTQAPSIGRIVHYTLSEQDAEAINRRRKDAANNLAAIRDAAAGYVAHTGNDVAAGDVFPLVITRVWGPNPDSAVNGQVMLDGNDTFWATSTSLGEAGEHRKYIWPPRA